jgi:hypothetical protein
MVVMMLASIDASNAFDDFGRAVSSTDTVGNTVFTAYNNNGK